MLLEGNRTAGSRGMTGKGRPESDPGHEVSSNALRIISTLPPPRVLSSLLYATSSGI